MTMTPPAGQQRAMALAERFDVAGDVSWVASVVGGAVATAAGAAALSVAGPFGLLAALFGVLSWPACG